MYCRATEKLIDMQDCDACWDDILDGNGGGWHRLCMEHNLVETQTILERLWTQDQQTVLWLVGLGLLSEVTIAEVIGVGLERAEGPNYYEKLMAHDSYKRVGGALRQVMWG